MSGCLQVGSVRSLGCYFSWLPLPNVTCTHEHAQLLHRTVCVATVVLTDNCCLTVQLRSLPLSLSLLCRSPIFSLSCSLPLSVFPASSIFLRAIFPAISPSLCRIFGKQLPMLKGRGRQRVGGRYTAHCSV